MWPPPDMARSIGLDFGLLTPDGGRYWAVAVYGMTWMQANVRLFNSSQLYQPHRSSLGKVDSKLYILFFLDSKIIVSVVVVVVVVCLSFHWNLCWSFSDNVEEFKPGYQLLLYLCFGARCKCSTAISPYSGNLHLLKRLLQTTVIVTAPALHKTLALVCDWQFADAAARAIQDRK